MFVYSDDIEEVAEHIEKMQKELKEKAVQKWYGENRMKQRINSEHAYITSPLKPETGGTGFEAILECENDSNPVDTAFLLWAAGKFGVTEVAFNMESEEMFAAYTKQKAAQVKRLHGENIVTIGNDRDMIALEIQDKEKLKKAFWESKIVQWWLKDQQSRDRMHPSIIYVADYTKPE